jgi:hypothetical protein
MQGFPEIPHGTWREVWPFYLVAAVFGSSGWIKVWLDSKKSPSEIERTRTEASVNLGKVVTGISQQLIDNQQYIERRRVAHEKEVQFLRQQLRYKEELEVIARNRAHAAMAEVQRCVFRIRDDEDLLRGRIEFQPFKLKTHAEIFGQEEIPSPPEWNE